MERTLVIIKPEAVAKNLIGKVVSIYEDNHLEVIHAHRVLATREVLKNHYHNISDKPFFDDVLHYMSSSEVLVLILEGLDAVSRVREINGPTNPADAHPGTIRYMYGTSLQENAVHGSDSPESALNEINIWRSLINYVD